MEYDQKPAGALLEEEKSVEMDQAENTYIIDSNSATELARLLDAERNTTWCMGGLFPEYQDLADITRVLDVACGPGGWALELAFQHPEINVVGVDISPRMVAYAQAQVQVSVHSSKLWL